MSNSDAGPQEIDRTAYWRARRDVHEFEEHFEEQFVEATWRPEEYATEWHDNFWKVIVGYWDLMQQPYMEATFLHPDPVNPAEIRDVWATIFRHFQYIYHQIGQLAMQEPPPSERYRMMLQQQARRARRYRRLREYGTAEDIMQESPGEAHSAEVRTQRALVLRQRWLHMMNDLARKLTYYGTEESTRNDDGFIWETNDDSIPAYVTDHIEAGYM